MLTGRGAEIFEENGHPVYHPSYTDNINGVPEELRSMIVKEDG